jgi:hypothetical protein
LLAGCRGGGDPTAADPERVYEDGFLSPLEEARVEAGDGTVVRGYDAWIQLFPLKDLIPRHDADYVYRDCAEPRAWFNRVLGSDALSPARSNLTCRELSDPRLGFDNGRWLLENAVDGRVYFRVWKRYP